MMFLLQGACSEIVLVPQNTGLLEARMVGQQKDHSRYVLNRRDPSEIPCSRFHTKRPHLFASEAANLHRNKAVDAFRRVGLVRQNGFLFASM